MGLNLLYAQVRVGTAQLGEKELCAPRLWLCRVSGGSRPSCSPASASWQTVSDIEHGWILVNKEQHRQLKSLQEKVSKKEVGEGSMP